jgi:hypothetical protein
MRLTSVTWMPEAPATSSCVSPAFLRAARDVGCEGGEVHASDALVSLAYFPEGMSQAMVSIGTSLAERSTDYRGTVRRSLRR